MARAFPRLVWLIAAAGSPLLFQASLARAGGHRAQVVVPSTAVVAASPVVSTPVVSTATTPLLVTTGGHGLGLFHHRQMMAAMPVQAVAATAMPVQAVAATAMPVQAVAATAGHCQVSSGLVAATPTVGMVSSVAATPTAAVSPTYVGYGGGSNLFVGNTMVAPTGYVGSSAGADEIDTLVSRSPQIQVLVGRLGNNKAYVQDLKNHLHTAVGKQLRQGGNLQGNRWVNLLMQVASNFLKARYGIDLSSLFETGTRSAVRDLIDNVLDEESDTIDNGGQNNNNDQSDTTNNNNRRRTPAPTPGRYRIRGSIEILDDGSSPPVNPPGNRHPVRPTPNGDIPGDPDAPAAPSGE